jgi:hypothetical protein
MAMEKAVAGTGFRSEACVLDPVGVVLQMAGRTVFR